MIYLEKLPNICKNLTLTFFHSKSDLLGVRKRFGFVNRLCWSLILCTVIYTVLYSYIYILYCTVIYTVLYSYIYCTVYVRMQTMHIWKQCVNFWCKSYAICQSYRHRPPHQLKNTLAFFRAIHINTYFVLESGRGGKGIGKSVRG